MQESKIFLYEVTDWNSRKCAFNINQLVGYKLKEKRKPYSQENSEKLCTEIYVKHLSDENSFYEENADWTITVEGDITDKLKQNERIVIEQL